MGKQEGKSAGRERKLGFTLSCMRSDWTLTKGETSSLQLLAVTTNNYSYFYLYSYNDLQCLQFSFSLVQGLVGFTGVLLRLAFS